MSLLPSLKGFVLVSFRMWVTFVECQLLSTESLMAGSGLLVFLTNPLLENLSLFFAETDIDIHIIV
jgi:hypothetical protein